MRSYKAARRRAQRRAEPIGFGYGYEVEVDAYGAEGKPVWEERTERFECHGKVDTLLLSELAYNADVDTATPEGMALIRQFFAQAFGVRHRIVVDKEGAEHEVLVEDEAAQGYRKFFKLHGQHGDDDLLMEIMGGLVADFQADRTTSPSVSADGPSESGDSSKVVSLSAGTVKLVPSGEEGETVWGPEEEQEPTRASGSSA